MSDQFYFSRDTKVYITAAGDTATAWEIPVLDGISFSQGTNTSEITLAEMSNGSGVSRRARQMFTDSYAPAEWSFSTYMRPFKASHAGATGTWENADVSAERQHAVEEVLWAFFVGASTFSQGDAATGTSWNDGITGGTSNMVIDFTASEKANLSEIDIYIELGAATAGNDVTYLIKNCAVNEASIDFDIDGIATINWAGFGKIIQEYESNSGNIPNFTKTITEGTTDTGNFIRNRLTSLTASATSAGSIVSSYDLVLTGGNITMSNNLTYLTPETLGIVNQPLSNITGTRTVGGSFTCYLNHKSTSSADLFEDIIESTDVITNDFALTFKVGGDSNTPRVEFAMPNCHLEVPSHSMDDIVSLETTFHALPGIISPSGVDDFEAKVTYVGGSLS